MSTGARVESIDALRSLRVALMKFAESANVALGEAEGEVRRVHQWVETEQSTFWNAQLRKRHEAVEKAKEAVRMKKLFKDSSGKPQSAVDEEKQLARAMRSLEEAQQKLRNVKKWSVALPKEMHQFQGAIGRLAGTVTSELPHAALELDKMVAALNAYVALDAPEVSGRVAGPLGGAGGMANAAAPPAAFAGPSPESGFTSIHAPVDPAAFPKLSATQVAVAYAEGDTGIVLTVDGSRFTGEGERFKTFDSFDAARQHAAAAVASDPKTECVIYDNEGRELLTIAPEAPTPAAPTAAE